MYYNDSCSWRGFHLLRKGTEHCRELNESYKVALRLDLSNLLYQLERKRGKKNEK